MKDMVHSIEQISRMDNARATSNKCNNNNSSSSNTRDVTTATVESPLNVTSVEVEWEKAECALETSSLLLPEDDVESSVSAATTASREAGRLIDRSSSTFTHQMIVLTTKQLGLWFMRQRPLTDEMPLTPTELY